MDLAAELERRHANVRAAMGEHGLDALIVSGNEYSGFEGAVTYMSGFQIVHRYAYVVLPADGDAVHRLPDGGALRRRARHDAARAGLPRPPGRAHRRSRARRRLEADRRLRARLHHGRARLPGARRPRSRRLRRRVRPRPRRQERGRARVRARLGADQPARASRSGTRRTRPGKTAAEVMAAAEEWFIAEGCGRLTMNMVLTGTDTYARPEFKIARVGRGARRVRAAVARGRRARHALGRGLARRARAPTSSRRTRRSG